MDDGAHLANLEQNKRPKVARELVEGDRLIAVDIVTLDHRLDVRIRERELDEQIAQL